MKNRIWILGFLAITICLNFQCQQAIDEADQPLQINDEITIQQIHDAYANGDYSVVELIQYYLNRIEAMNHKGPALHAVLTVNPDALSIAEALDKNINDGLRNQPLYGIPVLLKDNIDTQDKMPCTAGASSMANSFPLKDSPLAAQLRSAGAVILGKANLSEWANFHSNISSSGWSALGGQTRNPYDLSRNPCGSSAGSGVAVAANFCVIAIGTETNGSIVCPANNNGVVGIKPTVGLISRTGIIPISYTQDTGGPMARTVADAVRCLGVLTKPDPEDKMTLQNDRQAMNDYTPYLKENGLNGKRIGFYKANSNENRNVLDLLEKAKADLKRGGAEIIDLEQVMDGSANGHSFNVLLYEFKDGLNKYFESLGEQRVVQSLEDLISKTFDDTTEMKYHDHELLKLANEKGTLSDKEYINAIAKAKELSTEQGIDKVMDQNNLDAIIAPAGSPAWKTDLVTGDNYSVYSSSPAAIAGYPNICVPMGSVHGLPVGINIFGRKWSESKLIEIAYAYEQLSSHRFTPQYLDPDLF